MPLLLDTCTFIWLAAAPKRLSARARRALEVEAQIVLSHVSILEIALKWQAGQLELPAPPRVWVEAQLAEWQIASLPLSPDIMYRSSELADHHRDPFDRLLVAHAIEEALTIVTPDSAIARYPVAVLW